MRRDVALATFFWILVVLWMAFIFYCSAQPAFQSKEMSSSLIDFVVQALRRWFPELGIPMKEWHGFTRKLAHFVIYCVLGVLVIQAMRSSKTEWKRAIPTALAICVLYAISDEFHQLFVPGRGAQFSDVLLDSAGSTLGVYLFFGWKRLGLMRPRSLK